MDTKQFLEKILPDGGYYVLARIDNGRVRHRFYDKLGAMADDVERVAQRPGHNVYHGCSVFRAKERKQEFALLAKAFWVDVDVDPDKPRQAYADRAEAQAAIKDMVKTTGLPQPMVVSSGRGYHLYWPLTEAIDIDDWNRVAQALKAALKAIGFKQDPACTADSARILRPVGTINPKNGEPVEVKLDRGPYELNRVLQALPTEQPGDEIDLSRHSSSGLFDPDLDLSHTNYPKSSAHAVRGKCIALNSIVDEAATATEPEWRGMLGLVKHCLEGDELAHEWSSPHEDYDPVATQEKLDLWELGPTTCQYFDDLDLCTGCRFKSPKLKSPIMLGAVTTVEIKDAETGVSRGTYEMPQWPFSWNDEKERLEREYTDPQTGMPKQRIVSTSLVIAKNRVREPDGTYKLICERRKGSEAWQEFEIETALLARPTDLGSALAAREVVTPGKNSKTDMAELFGQYVDSLRYQGVETISCREFGFDGDPEHLAQTSKRFVIGTESVDVDGNWESVVASDHVPTDWRKSFGRKGTADDWAAEINEIYNHPGTEALQFGILAGFAAPLTALMQYETYHGMPIAYVSKSGYGKSSVAKAACSIYGKSSLLELDADRQSGGTIGAHIKKLATARHLPILFDEASRLRDEDIVHLLYAMSSGKDKERLNRDGTMRAPDAGWDTITFITSNRSLVELVAESEVQGVGDATSVRVFEIRLEEYMSLDHPFYSEEQRKRIMDKLPNLYGAAGERWVTYLLKHKEKIAAKVRDMEVKVRGNTKLDPAERFYYAMVSSVMLAGHLSKKLGLHDFDLNEIQKFATHAVQRQRDHRSNYKQNAMDWIGDFMRENSNSFIRTMYFTDKGKPRSEFVDRIPNQIFGRIASEDQRFFISSQPFFSYLKKHGLSGMEVCKELHRGGLLTPGKPIGPEPTSRDFLRCMTLGKGTNIQTTQEWVLDIDYSIFGGLRSVPAPAPAAAAGQKHTKNGRGTTPTGV